MPYKVVFSGELSPTTDIDEAKKSLATVFKLKPEAVDRIFCGQRVTIRKNADTEAARKFQQAAAGCGVIFELEPIGDSPATKPLPAEVAAAGKPVMVTCPGCGFSQSRSTTCLQCGEFLIKPEKKPREVEPAGIAIPASSTGRGSRSSGINWKMARISMLLLVLIVVGLDAYMTGRWTTDWDDPLWVGIYPINGDGQEDIANYIDSLEEEAFLPIADFFAEEAESHGLPLAEPFTIRLAPAVNAMPPPPPQGHNPLAVIWWSLKMRLWAYQNDTYAQGPSPDIKIFVVYHDARTSKLLENSLGIRKGLFGVVHAYAKYRMEPKNHVVIAHEILHTVGAKDKYDLETRQPIFPEGFADPESRPLYPQQLAEIMGSRIPLSQTQSKMPPTLNHTVIGEQTAREIKWNQTPVE